MKLCIYRDLTHTLDNIHALQDRLEAKLQGLQAKLDECNAMWKARYLEASITVDEQVLNQQQLVATLGHRLAERKTVTSKSKLDTLDRQIERLKKQIAQVADKVKNGSQKRKGVLEKWQADERRIQKRHEWLRQLIIAVPNDIVAHNLSQHAFTHGWCTKQFETRIKTYWELGVNQDGHDIVYNSNAYGATHGKLVTRKAPIIFFPYAPSLRTVTMLAETFHEDAEIHIQHETLSSPDAFVYGGVMPDEVRTQYVLDLMKGRVNKIPNVTKLPRHRTYLVANYAFGQALSNALFGEVKKGDKVRIINKAFDRSSVFLTPGKEVYYACTDHTGIKVALKEKIDNDTKLYKLGSFGAIQRTEIVTIDALMGLPTCECYTIVGTLEVVEKIAKTAVQFGYCNLEYYVL